MVKHPNRRSLTSERTPALPVSAARVNAASGQRKPAPVAAAGPSIRRAALLGHSVQSVAAGLIQPKLTLGPVADTYEREADSVAQQVMQQIAAPASPAPEGGGGDHAAPAAATAQRAPEDELKMKPLPGGVQRAPEDDLQTKPLAGVTQRAPEDELKMKPLAGSIQRAPEDELKMKPLAGSVQRSAAGAEGGPISGDLEHSIEGSRSGGGALDAGLRSQMEPAFGADFSGVRIHSDSNSHQLNQSLQARAFTTGQDIFFRGGEYQPQSSAGQELIAHELTHVVQQGASSAAKKA